MRRVLILFAVLLASFGFALGSPASARADNAAVAVNTKDGSSVFKFAFKIKHVLGEVVDEENAAVAFASCNSCSTTAIAIEIVLVAGSPSMFVPKNQAIAINYLCNLCNTFAAAYQFTIQAQGPVHFTSDGRQELAAIRKAIRELENANLTPFELAERLKPLIARLENVLATQLVDGPPVFSEDDGADASNAGETVPDGGTRTVETGPRATATLPAETAPTAQPETTSTTTATTTTTTTMTTPTTTEGTTTGETTTGP